MLTCGQFLWYCSEATQQFIQSFFVDFTDIVSPGECFGILRVGTNKSEFCCCFPDHDYPCFSQP